MMDKDCGSEDSTHLTWQKCCLGAPPFRSRGGRDCLRQKIQALSVININVVRCPLTVVCRFCCVKL